MLNQHKHSSRTGLIDIVIALVIASALAGFAASAKAANGQAWIALDSPGIDQAWVNPERTPSHYTHYRIEPIGFWHLAAPETTDTSLITAVRTALQQRFSQAFEEAGLIRANASNSTAAATLVLRLQLVDLLLHAPDLYDPTVADQYRFDLAPGHITLVSELATGDGTVLLRAADMQAGGEARGWRGVETLLIDFQGRLGSAFAAVGLPGGPSVNLASR
ncbi:MAG: hypothetical protein AAGH76_16440 [Pseudomonadota bacterium]